MDDSFKTHVLVVDDDHDLRMMMRMLLEDVGFTVHEAKDGRRALEILRQTPHRMVVLLDLIMPGMTGVDVLNTVAADRALSARHAFALTSAWPQRLLNSTSYLQTRLSIPVVLKPFDPEALIATVEELARRISWVRA